VKKKRNSERHITGLIVAAANGIEIVGGGTISNFGTISATQVLASWKSRATMINCGISTTA